ncbi:MAG: carboxypeptidase regulatory-like domain-containing protein [Candidatus Solibacter usitatus]|nr:carboxypeptidase regulatory-like domain-containing protein [Candidatus Solibacter usitatus]
MKIFLPCAILVCCAVSAVCQNIKGTVTGRVTDAAGSTIPDVALTLTNTGTNLVFTAKTLEDGKFVFLLLQPGKYRLAAGKAGFRRFATEVFPIDVDDTHRIDVVLQVGDVAESVTVFERPGLVENETSSLGSVISTREIEELPMNGRNPMSVAEFAPGFQPLNGFGDGLQVTRAAAQMVAASNFSSNGGITGNNEILLDGVPMTVCCQGQAVLIPSADSVSQVKVQTNSTTAEFGRTSGGVLNMITKSGTNQFHGSAFEFFRNEKLDAANFFTNRSAKQPIPGRDDFRGPLRFNQFGFTAGGPVLIPRFYNGRNRTFFFFGWEGTHTRTSNYNNTVTPPTAMRSGDFTQSPFLIYDPTTLHLDENNTRIRDPFPDRRIPAARISPIANNYLKFFPQPDIPGVVQNYSWTASTETDDNQGNVKIDHNFNEANRFFARFSISDNTNVVPDWIDNSQPTGNHQYVTAHTFVMDYVRVLKTSMVLDVRAAFAKQRNKNFGNANLYNASSLGFSRNFVSQQAFDAFPSLTVSGYRTLGAIARRDWDHYTYALNTAASWMHGGHTLKFGWDGRMFVDNTVSLDNGGGTFTFDGNWAKGPGPNIALPAGSQPYYSMATFLLGNIGGGTLLYRDSVARNQLYNAFFLQDDWRVSRRLTLNIGLRLEIETGFKERYNRQSFFDPTAVSPLSSQVEAQLGRPVYGAVQFAGVNGAPRNLWATSRNWGPRFGFAYSINPKTVIRSAFGITYFPTTQRAYILSSGQGYSITNTVTTNIDSVTPIASFADPWPSEFPVVRPTGNQLGPNTGYGSNPNGGVYHSSNSYVEQWNAGFQRELPGHALLTVSYGGGHGVKLPLHFNANDINPVLFGAKGDAAAISALQRLYPNPFFGLIRAGNQSNANISAQLLNARFPQYSTLQLQYMPWGNSSYNSMQVSLSKSMRSGFSTRVAFTWSKSLGNINNLTTADSVGEGNANYQNSYARAIERSVATVDIPRRLALNATYEVPFGKRRKYGANANPWLRAAFGGWQTNTIFTIQDGLPLQFTGTGQPAYGGSRPNYVSLDPQAYTTGAIEDRLGGVSGGPGYLDRTAFRLPQSFEFGNVPRVNGVFRGPRPFNLNLSLNKYFPIRERARMQFRGEVFNPLNHPIFGNPNAQFGNAAFGTIGGLTNRPRNVQFGLKLLW